MKAIYNHIIFTGLAGLLTVNVALAQNEAPVQTQNSANAKITDLAPTPPMGWNSWNTFQTRIDEKLLRDMVDAFVSSGMRDAGYKYFTLDDGWMSMERNQDGQLVADPKKFPSGIKAFADYVHSKGLKFGIYNCAGDKTCAGYPGTRGHEYEDARLYASWGVDLLKYDWCNTDSLNAREAYITMARALQATGRPILFSLCEWGNHQPWLWANGVGEMYRVTGDITANFDNDKHMGSWTALSVLSIVDKQAAIRQYDGPNHWNDLDMLEVGNGMSFTEDKAHFSLWCMLAAPLIAGNDLRKMSEQTKSILTNKAVIAIDQDTLGVAAYRNSSENGLETWAKPLSNGNWAICFLNRSDKAQDVTYNWAKHPLQDGFSKRTADFTGAVYSLHDVWAKKAAGTTKELFKTSIPAHDVVLLLLTLKAQTVVISGKAKGERFDGIGAVSGGGATSVLLKDYPEAQRKQVLDLLFKPKFGASLSALLVEVPGDGNSTQGAEPSHMHTKNDENYFRGYEWWIMKEAKSRNPEITLDANGWSAPRWVGNNHFWSQDMCDYYVKWIKGLKNAHGLALDAIGCRNEKGTNYDFVKKFRKTLDSRGLAGVKIHAFDNWPKDKFDFVKDMQADTALSNAIDILSAHTMSEIPTPPAVIRAAKELNKPIWNSEEHVYKEGFDCAISIVKAFNENFIGSGVTKIVNWYLVGSTYSIEPYADTPPMMIAREPWSGHYSTREALWGYAHYGQFTAVGWEYLKDACGKLDKGGTYVTMKSPKNDYSVIIETKGASEPQVLSFKVTDGLSNGSLCVWKSNAAAQFVRINDIVPVNGAFDLHLDTGAIYSLSTTRGQQKGSFQHIPGSKPFPYPYYETFEEYKSPRQFGYLPNYTADIAGGFEIADRVDNKGKCLRQVLSEMPQSWAPEWMPYTIFGDSSWTNYEVSADIYIEKEGSAGVMGRVNATGTGYGSQPNAYYMTLSAEGNVGIYVVTQDRKIPAKLLGSGKLPIQASNSWHRVSLTFSEKTIKGFVDNVLVLQASDNTYSNGMAGLMTVDESTKRSTAQFDNLKVNAVDTSNTLPRGLAKGFRPIYDSTN